MKKKNSFIKRFFIYFFTILGLIIVLLLGVVLILEFGPSKTARNLFVNSAMESSAGKFLATLFISDEEIKKIQESNSVQKTNEVTNSDLINVDENATDEIEIIDITGPTYKGLMAIVHDPSRVSVGISGDYKGEPGKTVSEMAEAQNAVMAINGGGFQDAGGVGNGGTPIGIVISNSELKFGSLTTTYELIGFDKNNKLVVGNMTGQEALDRGVRDALSFGPILVVNGNPSVVNGTGGGLNPRTAIGQREDGAVLLLVIDGRQANSLGASYEDVLNVMVEHGAVNAANLDGGSSSLLYYQGEYINNCASLYGPRNMPTSFIVR